MKLRFAFSGTHLLLDYMSLLSRTAHIIVVPRCRREWTAEAGDREGVKKYNRD